MRKVVVITGASSGIGKALAMEYAHRNYNVVVAARNEECLKELSVELSRLGANVLVVPTDVSKESECKALISKTIEKFDRIDILINNAGISMRTLFSDLELFVIHKVMDVNFWGTINCSKFALPYLLESKGSLVGVSSITGYTPLPARTGYAASKYAIHGFLQSLRIEHLHTGLHVLIASPGFTESNIRKTALTYNGEQQGESPRPERQMMSSEKVAKLIAKAVEKRQRTLILTFMGKSLVLLYKFFPALVDRIIYKQMKKEDKSPIR